MAPHELVDFPRALVRFVEESVECLDPELVVGERKFPLGPDGRVFLLPGVPDDERPEFSQLRRAEAEVLIVLGRPSVKPDLVE